MNRFSDWRRYFGYARNWAVAFVFLVGLLSGVAQLTPISMTARLSASLLLSAAAVAIIYAVRRTQHTHLPVADMLPCVASHQGKYLLCCPCDRRTSSAANGIANRHYGNENVTFDHYEQWRLKNPNILACLTSPSGEALGYFDVLPLRSTFIDAFLCGQVTEREVTHEDLLGVQHAPRCRKLYLAGFAVADPDQYVGKRGASMMVWGLMKYLQHYYPTHIERKLFALAATKDGEQLLTRFGFRISCPETQRRDNHRLYVMTLNESTISAVLQSIPDWSTVCCLAWTNSIEKKSRMTSSA